MNISKKLDIELNIKTWCLPFAISFSNSHFLLAILCLQINYNFKK